MRKYDIAAIVCVTTCLLAIPALATTNLQFHNRVAQSGPTNNQCFRGITCLDSKPAVPSPFRTPSWWGVKPHKVA
jgi:hypothetical protein